MGTILVLCTILWVFAIKLVGILRMRMENVRKARQAGIVREPSASPYRSSLIAQYHALSHEKELLEDRLQSLEAELSDYQHRDAELRRRLVLAETIQQIPRLRLIAAFIAMFTAGLFVQALVHNIGSASTSDSRMAERPPNRTAHDDRIRGWRGHTMLFSRYPDPHEQCLCCESVFSGYVFAVYYGSSREAEAHQSDTLIDLSFIQWRAQPLWLKRRSSDYVLTSGGENSYVLYQDPNITIDLHPGPLILNLN